MKTYKGKAIARVLVEFEFEDDGENDLLDQAHEAVHMDGGLDCPCVEDVEFVECSPPLPVGASK